jgi:hypothetical protein
MPVTIIEQNEKWKESGGLARAISKFVEKDGFDLATDDFQEIIFNQIRNKKKLSRKDMKKLYKLFIETIGKIEISDMTYLEYGLDNLELECDLDMIDENDDYLPIFREVEGLYYKTPIPSILYETQLLK